MRNKNWHTLNQEELFAELKTSKNGLSSLEFDKRLARHGKNLIPRKKGNTYLEIALRQVKSSLVLLLFGAALISFLLKEFVDAGVILFAVALNTIMGFIQEAKAEQALEALSSIVKHKAFVLRDGIEKEIDSEDIVVGDILILKAGDKVLADGRIIENYELEVDESVLTGESLPAPKVSRTLKDENAKAQSQKNMVYMGSSVIKGRGVVVVTATGVKTKFGKIAELLANTEEIETPLQIQLDKFSKYFGKLTLVIVFLVVVIGLYRGMAFFDIFMTSIAIAVAAIPEGMLVAVTIILAIGMQRTLKNGSLIRKLIAVETLGSVTLICTDKTGTLTKGTMQLDHIVTIGSVVKINNVCKESFISEEIKDAEHIFALKIGMVCNDAVIENPHDKIESWVIHGGYTEKAFLWAGICAGFDSEDVNKRIVRVNEIPFSSERKFMATLNKEGGKYMIYAKGAAEEMINRSEYVFSGGKIRKMNEDDLRFLRRKQVEMSKEGLRVLAVAFKEADSKTNALFKESNDENVVNNLVFVGLMALKDPLRVEAKDTIRLAKEAGIRTIIITGDNALTAKAIATELGMKIEDENIMEGEHLDRMSDNDFAAIVSKVKVYARVSPRHKSRIVDAWQAKGEVVAMTGDGVNDAPALKKADIGIALGSGTEVAKETADVVLLDDNFKTIISAVEQGRIIFENIRKVILYLISDSFSEVVVVAGSLLLGLAVPITAPQILWINLVTDGLPNVALAFEPGEKDVMKQAPRKKSESLFNGEIKILVLAISILSGVVSLIVFDYIFKITGDFKHASSIIFSILSVDSLFYVFSIRFLESSMFKKNIFSNKYLILAVLLAFFFQFLAIYNPFLQGILQTEALSFNDWMIIFFVSIFNIIVIEIIKYVFILHKNHKK